MSINLLLGNALSGLETNQSALRQVSNNISNVNTPNYARRVVHQEAVVLEGQAAGVAIEEVTRAVNTFFTRQSISAVSDEARYDAETRLHDRIQALLGDPSQGNTLADRLNDVLSSVSETLVDPASGVRRDSFLSDVNAMALAFTQMADEIQTIRGEIDQEVAATVGRINDTLSRLTDLNQQIQKQVFQGETSTSLIDQRDTALAELAEMIDIEVTNQSDGTVQVTTQTGFPLVGTGTVTLTYNNPAAVTANSLFPEITVARETSTGVQSNYSGVLDGHISGGALKGLITMRDIELPQFAEQVGELASAIVDEINAIHNDSTAMPPLATMTGRNTGLDGADLLGFTGRSSLAVVDGSGALVNRIEINFDTNTLSVDGGAPVALGATVTDAVTALNAALGAALNVSFSGGVMSVSASGGNGVAFLQDETAPSSRGGRGFSHFFGLNDLLSAHQSSHFQAGLTAGETHRFPPGQTTEFRVYSPDGSVAQDVTFTIDASWTTIGDIVGGLNSTSVGLGTYYTFTLDTTGAILVTPKAGYAEYDLQAGADSTNRGGTGKSLTALFGIGGAAQAEQARNMSVRTDISLDSDLVAFAKLDLSGLLTAGDIVVTSGDNRGALALQALSGTNVTFEHAGHLSDTVTTLSTYAGMVIADVSNRASIADARLVQATSFREEVTARRDEVQGVNLDEELSNMMIYQQAYNASARMFSTAQELYDTLLQLV